MTDSSTSHPRSPQAAPASPPPRRRQTTESGLEWLGPVTVTRRYAGRCVDEDSGDKWGRLHDQRLTHRHPLGSDAGLLSVYDATWGEYAVLAEDVSLQAVRQVAVRAVATDPHMAPTGVAALVLGSRVAQRDPVAPSAQFQVEP